MLVFAKYLTVFFLIGLQLVAPLVHAHAGENYASPASGKLHIPGLEYFNTESQSLGFTADRIRVEVEGFVIAIDAGINAKHQKYLSFDNGKTLVFANVTLVVANNHLATLAYSPDIPSVFSRIQDKSRLQRAPPKL